MPRTACFRPPSGVLARLLPLFLLGCLATTGAAPRRAPAAASARAAQAAAPVRVTSVEGITEYRLANGLKVLLFPDPSKENATVNITYLVGSRHEGYGETGMAHLLEHLMFKGTPKHPNISQELTSHGTRPNGTTWYDRTNYFETFTATEENLDWALDLEADRMVNSFIARKDLDSEMTVVRNEFEMGENYPQSILEERMMSAAYLWHNYGKSTIGSRVDLERVPIDNLKAFYRLWYQPDNAVLIVAGRFDEAATLAKIARRFGAIPKPTRKLPAVYTEEPAQDGERAVTLRRVGDTQAAGVAYHVPAGSHPDFPAVEILAFILGDSPSGRLHRALVAPGKAASVSGSAGQYHDPGMLTLMAEVRLEHPLEEVRDILIQTAEGVAARPPTEAEVNRGRDNLLKQWETAMRSSERSAIGLSEYAALGDWRCLFLERDRLKEVTVADVARVAKAYLVPENRTVGLYYPTKEATRAEIPPSPDLTLQLKDFKGGEALAQGEAFEATPAHIEARAVRATLPPGIKLVMVPKKTRGGTVSASLMFRLGNPADLKGRGPAGQYAGMMLMRGSTHRSRQQIKDEIDHLKAQISVGGAATLAYATLNLTGDRLADGLRLVAELLREPAYADSEFAQLKQEMLANLENARKDPNSMAGTALSKHLNPWPKDDPRYVSDTDESIAALNALTPQDLRAFHRDFYGASTAQIALIGDFEPEAMKALLAQLFGEWKSPRPFERLVTPFVDRPALNVALESPDKESASMSAGLRLNLRDDDPEFPALTLGNFMLGGGFLNSRLATRIRQKDGLSYGVGSYLNASSLDHSGTFGGYAIYAPQNAEKLVTAFREEITRALDQGFTQEEIADARKGWLQSRKVSYANDAETVGRLTTNEFLGRTLQFSADLEAKVSALTNDQIVAALRKQIGSADRISIVQAGDFAKARKAVTPAN